MHTAQGVPNVSDELLTGVGIEAILRVGTLAISQKSFVHMLACSLVVHMFSSMVFPA